LPLNDETLREWLGLGGFQEQLDLTLLRTDRETGELVLSMPFHRRFERAPESGQWHGGPIAALIDIAGDYVLMMMLARPIPTISMNVDYLRPAVNTALIAHARVIRAGRSIGVAGIEILDDQQRLIAVGRGTYSTVETR